VRGVIICHDEKDVRTLRAMRGGEHREHEQGAKDSHERIIAQRSATAIAIKNYD
jgi:hypothetical protein